MKLFRRIVLAWRILRQRRPAFAVIYDFHDTGVEEYYEAFDSPEEAAEMFNTAFGDLETVHNARIVLILDRIKESKD